MIVCNVGSEIMTEKKTGRHVKPRPAGESAMRRAVVQAGGKRVRTGDKTRALNKAQRGTKAKKRAAFNLPFIKKNPNKARRPMNRENLKTALWLWCFPVGLNKMWRGSCTWPRGVKIGITAAMAAILVAIFAMPTPTADKYTTGVQMVAGKPEVEVYGPALPSLIVQGYTRENTGSIIVPQATSDVHYVYAADDADCYHEYECKFAFASSQRLTVYEAYHLGFKPCGRCNPPVYIPGETDPITAKPLHGDATAQTADEAVPEETEG